MLQSLPVQVCCLCVTHTCILDVALEVDGDVRELHDFIHLFVSQSLTCEK